MIKGIQKAIWLHIYTHGGNWTPDEIAAAFGMGRARANVTLQNMATRGKVLARARVEKRSAFGVTEACAVPKGVTLQELRKAPAAVAPADVAQAEANPA